MRREDVGVGAGRQTASEGGGVGAGTTVGAGTGIGVGARVGTGLVVGDGVGLGVGDGDGDGLGEGDGVGEPDGVGDAGVGTDKPPASPLGTRRVKSARSEVRTMEATATWTPMDGTVALRRRRGGAWLTMMARWSDAVADGASVVRPSRAQDT